MNSELGTPRVAKGSPEDRLSDLPDSIICHILSFLPTKHAAITSVLSSRWKNTFLALPKIVLDESLLSHPQEEEEEEESEGTNPKEVESRRIFFNYVTKRIQLSQTSALTEFDIWAQAKGTAQHMPSEIFTCKTLVVLKLGGDVILKVPELVDMPNLKVMHLERVKFLGDNSDWDLSDGWPLLVELQMEGVACHGISVLNISIPSLRSLVLGQRQNEYKIIVDAPNLQYFEYYDVLRYLDEAKNLGALIRADLTIVAATAIISGNLGYWLMYFAVKVTNVKSLRLSGDYMKNFYDFEPLWPEFPKLTHLELVDWCAHNSTVVKILLRRAPNLEVLVCDMRTTWRSPDDAEDEALPKCLVLHLREVELRNFSADQSQQDFIKYLLQYGAVLTKITIKPLDVSPRRLRALFCKEFPKFSRCSKECRVLLG